MIISACEWVGHKIAKCFGKGGEDEKVNGEVRNGGVPASSKPSKQELRRQQKEEQAYRNMERYDYESYG